MPAASVAAILLPFNLPLKIATTYAAAVVGAEGRRRLVGIHFRSMLPVVTLVVSEFAS
jgi:hypothetical protein